MSSAPQPTAFQDALERAKAVSIALYVSPMSMLTPKYVIHHLYCRNRTPLISLV